MNNIRIALIGLGETGQEFADSFLTIIQEGNKPIEIVAVVHDDMCSPLVMGFESSDVPTFEEASPVLDMGKEVDIIFDLTGDPAIDTMLKQGLKERNNKHTLIAHQVLTRLLFLFLDEEESEINEQLQMLRNVGH